MPNIDNIQAEVVEILASQVPSESDNANPTLEQAKLVVFKLACRLLQRESSIYGVFDVFLRELLSSSSIGEGITHEKIERDLVDCLFKHVGVDLLEYGEANWGGVFIATAPSDLALLIRQVSHEMMMHGPLTLSHLKALPIFNWIKDKTTMLRVFSVTNEEKLGLVSLSERLTDSSTFSIPKNPFFCMNSARKWYIFDQDTVASMLMTNHDYRRVINEIDSSGPTGIDYVLSHLSADESEVNQALNKVLVVWHHNFPTDVYNVVDTFGERQMVLSAHEQWLDRTDRFLDWIVWSLLPEDVRQLTELLGQFNKEQTCLTELSTLIAAGNLLRETRETLNREYQSRSNFSRDLRDCKKIT